MKLRFRQLGYLFGKIPIKNTEKFLLKNFKDIIYKDYSNLPTESGSKIIWSLWFQGKSEAPKVIQNCFESQRLMAENIGFEQIILSLDTLKEYLTISPVIMKKYQTDKISHAHFSDYIRSKLMYEYGGIWLDSTCFAYNDLNPEIVDKYDFWNVKGIPNSFYDKDLTKNYQNNVISARKGSHLYLAMCQMFEIYFLKDNYQPITYLYMFNFYRLLITENREFEQSFHKISDSNQNLFIAYSTKSSEIKKVLSSDTCIYKLTYRDSNNIINQKNELTFYGELLKEKNLLK